MEGEQQLRSTTETLVNKPRGWVMSENMRNVVVHVLVRRRDGATACSSCSTPLRFSRGTVTKTAAKGLTWALGKLSSLFKTFFLE